MRLRLLLLVLVLLQLRSLVLLRAVLLVRLRSLFQLHAYIVYSTTTSTVATKITVRVRLLLLLPLRYCYCDHVCSIRRVVCAQPVVARSRKREFRATMLSKDSIPLKRQQITWPAPPVVATMDWNRKLTPTR